MYKMEPYKPFVRNQTNMKTRVVDQIPEGLLVNRPWLARHGVARPNLDSCLRSGRLHAVQRGIYTRCLVPVKWRNVVYSLLEMGVRVHVGGCSALELAGLGHFVNPEGMKSVELYGECRPPSWLAGIQADVEFHWRADRLFEQRPGAAASGMEAITFGTRDWRLPVSSPERAILEFLERVPAHESFQHADLLMEGLVNLSPRKLAPLLVACRSVKVKRLFLWLAERHGHAWAKHLDRSALELGAGKRSLAKGGRLDAKYLITVPRELADESR